MPPFKLNSRPKNLSHPTPYTGHSKYIPSLTVSSSMFLWAFIVSVGVLVGVSYTGEGIMDPERFFNEIDIQVLGKSFEG